MDLSNLNKTQLSKILGCSMTTISNYESYGMPKNSNGKYHCSDVVKWYGEYCVSKQKEKIAKTHNQELNKLQEKIDLLKDKETPELNDLNIELKKEKIKSERVNTLSRQARLTLSLGMMCNRREEEFRFARILLEVKNRIMNTTTSLSNRLESRDSIYIKSTLDETLRTVFESIPVDLGTIVDTPEEKDLDKLLEELSNDEL